MSAFLASLLAAAQPAPFPNVAPIGRTAWVVATVGHSEWCPAGNVRLDLATGRYSYTPRAPRRICNQPGLERPTQVGTLRAGRLEAARSAFRRALAQGLVNPACANGGRPREIVISNGGRQILLLTTGKETLFAPEDLGCWSQAAIAFHAELRRLFESAERP